MKNYKFQLTFLTVSTLVLSFFIAPLDAQMSGALTLLEISDGKYAALGEAGTAGQNDVAVMNYNPAGLGSLETSQASFLYQKGLTEDAFGRFMIGTPLRKHTLGASIGYYDAGTLEIFDGTETKEVSAQQDLLVTLGWARKSDRFRVGMNAKFLRSTLAEEFSATTAAMDLGVQSTVSSRLRMGAAVQNLGKGLKYLDETDPLPLNYRLGAAYLLLAGKNPTTLLLDAPYFKNEKELRPAVGLDVAMGILSLRGGYRDNGDRKEFSVGAGFLLGRSSLDYSFGLANQLSASHRVSLSMRFGTTPAPVFVNKNIKNDKKEETEKVAAKESAPVVNSKSYNLGSLAPRSRPRTRNIYVVKDGDTLASIAKKQYGTTRSWKSIYSANKHLLEDPTKIETGQKIVLP